MNYGSPFYLLMLILLFFLTAGLYFLLKNRSVMLKKCILFALMMINVFQHLFKWAIYPMYDGMGFNVLSTAYNMCAFLILFSPIAFFSKSDFLKNLVFPVGAAAGLVANLVPYWYVGMSVSELGWEYARFYICHSLLFVTSALVIMLDLHKPKLAKFWQPAVGFLFALVMILTNDVIAVSLGIFDGYDKSDLYGALLGANPCFSMGPPENFAWLADISAVFTPSVFLGNNKTGMYTPILWYAIPLLIGISIIAFLLFFAIDKSGRKEFIDALGSLKEKLQNRLSKKR